MCGSENGMIWGGFIVAGAMLAWAFTSNGEAASHSRPATVALEAPAPRPGQTTLTVSANGVALSFDSVGVTVRLAL